ncbi:MAG: rod shape-determining protein MreD [Geminicoccaceae bacterium]|nr:MAG: rod shape-determining protein MreD [Geminicoccaceae bacterium]
MPFSPLRFEQGLRYTLPLLVAMLAVFVDVAPRPAAGGGGLGPFLTLIVVYFWCIYRPDIMSFAAVFGIGALFDLMSGQPLGLTSLAFVLGRAALMARQRFFHAKSFMVIWALFVLLTVGVESVRWALGVVVTGAVVDPSPLVFQALLTIAIYPAVTWVLVRLHGQVLVGGAHAKS